MFALGFLGVKARSVPPGKDQLLVSRGRGEERIPKGTGGTNQISEKNNIIVLHQLKAKWTTPDIINSDILPV